MYDCIVLGGGPAGISAGIYVKRTGSSVLVIDNDKSVLSRVKVVQNYYGTGSISGSELKNRGVRQYKSLGGEYAKAEAIKIRNDDGQFAVLTKDQTYYCRALILALGAGKKKTVEGLEKFEKANVSYCAVCDGFFYSGRDVAVLGDGDFAFSEAEELSKNARNVYIIGQTCKKPVKLAKNIQVINKTVKSFEGDELVEKIVFDDQTELKVDGVFVALGALSTFEICKQMGIVADNNRIIVDNHFMTNIAGVFAAGDCIGGLLQVSKAVSDGAQAGLEAVRFIKMMEE